ncbi:hypothetical protein BGZ98_000439 [Dissophora globulifera]|nr:hypothetical protein BGZ98_000439 [Dissophora globulifera]
MTIAHVVLLKVKPSVSEEKAQEILKALAGLREKLPKGVMQSVHLGTNFAVHNQGFTHSFTMTFKTKEDLEFYNVSEVHQDVAKNLVFPNIDDVLAVDYNVADYSYPLI